MTEQHRDEVGERRAQLDELLVELLATGRTYAEAGDVAQVSERTVRRRMATECFAARVSKRRGEYVGALAGQLVGADVEAVTVLRASLAADSPAVQLRAAHLILSLGTQLRAAQEFEDRLVALETAAGATVDEASTSTGSTAPLGCGWHYAHDSPELAAGLQRPLPVAPRQRAGPRGKSWLPRGIRTTRSLEPAVGRVAVLDD
jgi:hypothetical protein